MNLTKFAQALTAEKKDDGTGARHLSAQEFRALLAETQEPVVVDFWAEWCGPCHMMAPAVDQLARDFADRAVVAKVNADRHPELLEQYGIMGIPTLIYFQNGKEADRVIGVTPYLALRARLEGLAKA